MPYVIYFPHYVLCWRVHLRICVGSDQHHLSSFSLDLRKLPNATVLLPASSAWSSNILPGLSVANQPVVFFLVIQCSSSASAFA